MAKGQAASEAAQLRKHHPKLTLGAAHALRREIIGKGSTVAAYLASPSEPVHGRSDALAIFGAAQQLLQLAGSAEKASKAISMVSEFES